MTKPKTTTTSSNNNSSGDSGIIPNNGDRDALDKIGDIAEDVSGVFEALKDLNIFGNKKNQTSPPIE